MGFTVPVLFKLWSKIPKYCKSYVRKGKSAIRTLALTSQKPELLSWQTCEFLTHTPHQTQTHTNVHTEADIVGKIREDLPARWKCLPFSPHCRFFTAGASYFKLQQAWETQVKTILQSSMQIHTCPNIRAGRGRLTFPKHKILVLFSLMQPSPKLMKTQTTQWT